MIDEKIPELRGLASYPHCHGHPQPDHRVYRWRLPSL